MADASNIVDVAGFAERLNTLQRSLLEAFLTESPLHGGGKGLENVDKSSLPTAADLEHNVRHFLGYYMIKKFDVLNFLEDTGIYVEGLDAGDDDAQRVQRKWQKPIYTAAPTVVYRFLTWLCENGFFTKADLAGALSIAQQSIDELPNCALLSEYLPGPRYSAYELSAPDTSTGVPSGMVADMLQARYQDACPSLNFWGLAAAAEADQMKVKEEHSTRMHVMRIANRCQVAFTTCMQNNTASWSEPEGGLTIEFDEPIAALFRVGMIVTATFQRLSDGSSSRWELSSPGYCWPSWCCVQGCLSKFAARRSRAPNS